ncbi:hypothetical protein, partial [Mangrovicoccus ximenensis]|uniref:hypothetical protein n=1 Tax=Mangrovicoccus ximenensis TaxID=1911570 RepID=UPI00191C2F76
AQRFTAAGQRLGQEVRLNQIAAGSQSDPQVKLDGDGNLVLAYADGNARDGSGTGVFLARFSPELVPLGAEIQVNELTRDGQNQPALTVLADGAIMVAWHDDWGTYYQGSPQYQGYYEVRAKIYEADGTTVRTPEFPLSGTVDTGQQNSPELAALGSGAVAVWRGAGAGDNDGIFARILDADGTELAAPFRVNATTSGGQYEPEVAVLSDGRFAVMWSGTRDGDGDGVVARVFNADGTAASGEIAINADAYSTDRGRAIIAGEAGGFTIAWHDYSYQNGESPAANYTYGTFFREVAHDAGTDSYAAGAVTQINAGTGGDQTNPDLAWLGGGLLAAVFQSDAGSDGSGTGVYLRLFGPEGALDGAALAPRIEGLPERVAFAENDGPQLIDPGMAAALSDADSTSFGGGRLVFGHLIQDEVQSYRGPLEGRDQHVLGLLDAGTGPGQIGLSGNAVSYGGTAIGTVVSDGQGGRDLVIALEAAAGRAAVEALIEHLTYDNVSDNPAASTQLFVSLEEASGIASAAVPVTVEVAADPDALPEPSLVRVANTSSAGSQTNPSIAALFEGGAQGR